MFIGTVIVANAEVQTPGPFLSGSKKQGLDIKVGSSKAEVLADYGKPTLINTSGQDEIFEYFLNPELLKHEKSKFAGFEVFFKNGRVYDVEDIYGHK